LKINIITTLDIEKDENNMYFTEEEINNIYNEFKQIIKTAHESQDITDFSFINTDTNMEIEDEREE